LTTVLEVALGAITIREASHHGGCRCCGAMVSNEVGDGEVILMADAGHNGTWELG
jgi:hypothetical protein